MSSVLSGQVPRLYKGSCSLLWMVSSQGAVSLQSAVTPSQEGGHSGQRAQVAFAKPSWSWTAPGLCFLCSHSSLCQMTVPSWKSCPWVSSPRPHCSLSPLSLGRGQVHVLAYLVSVLFAHVPLAMAPRQKGWIWFRVSGVGGASPAEHMCVPMVTFRGR
jgi:hypothetical protein